MLERLKPSWVHEIRHLDSVHQERVLFNWVAHLIRVFSSVLALSPKICDWVNNHFKQFVARGDTDNLMGGNRRFNEHLGNWLSILGDIMITKCTGRIRVIKVHELPVGWLRLDSVVKCYRNPRLEGNADQNTSGELQ